MKIIYIGNHPFASYALSEEANRHGDTFVERKLAQGETLEDLQSELISQAATVYCFDLTSLPDSEEVLAEELEQIKQAVNARILLYAPG